MKVRIRNFHLLFLAGVFVLLSPVGARAHVGSPDIYLQAMAGPYPVSVVIRPPDAIPGVAQIEVRSSSPELKSLRATPLPMIGPGAAHPPVPETLQISTQDRQYFTGGLWLMQSGSWQVRLYADGAKGSGVLSVPVPSVARSTKQMQTGMGVGLAAFGLFLVIGFVAIAGASAREAQLAPNAVPGMTERRRALVAMSIAGVIVIAATVGGRLWWNSEASDYGRYIYKPLQMKTSVADGVLTLQLLDPGWTRLRRLDDLVPDHNHLMHVYAVRMPEMDAVYHLHPEQAEPGVFRLALPNVQGGRYRLYADIVHRSGFPETVTGTVELPEVSGHPMTGDDAGGAVPSVGQASGSDTYVLPDGYRMVFDRPAQLHARRPESFRFDLVDAQGRPATDVQLYMGMMGHAAFLRTDAPGTVFAHVHPSGSVSMAALLLAAQQNGQRVADFKSAGMSDMPGMEMPMSQRLPNEVSFPYGFPTPGQYRIVVQMKRGGTVETAVFDAPVEP
jgi:hypothetical protein